MRELTIFRLMQYSYEGQMLTVTFFALKVTDNWHPVKFEPPWSTVVGSRSASTCLLYVAKVSDLPASRPRSSAGDDAYSICMSRAGPQVLAMEYLQSPSAIALKPSMAPLFHPFTALSNSSAIQTQFQLLSFKLKFSCAKTQKSTCAF
jgi:hypothetical protein